MICQHPLGLRLVIIFRIKKSSNTQESLDKLGKKGPVSGYKFFKNFVSKMASRVLYCPPKKCPNEECKANNTFTAYTDKDEPYLEQRLSNMYKASPNSLLKRGEKASFLNRKEHSKRKVYGTICEDCMSLVYTEADNKEKRKMKAKDKKNIDKKRSKVQTPVYQGPSLKLR